MSLHEFDISGGDRRGRFGGKGASKAAFPELWRMEGLVEAAQHAKNVHAPEVVRERERRTRFSRYEAMKAELYAARAASDPTVSLPPAPTTGE